jgi:hypothetical protein
MQRERREASLSSAWNNLALSEAFPSLILPNENECILGLIGRPPTGRDWRGTLQQFEGCTRNSLPADETTMMVEQE